MQPNFVIPNPGNLILKFDDTKSGTHTKSICKQKPNVFLSSYNISINYNCDGDLTWAPKALSVGL